MLSTVQFKCLLIIESTVESHLRPCNTCCKGQDPLSSSLISGPPHTTHKTQNLINHTLSLYTAAHSIGPVNSALFPTLSFHRQHKTHTHTHTPVCTLDMVLNTPIQKQRCKDAYSSALLLSIYCSLSKDRHTQTPSPGKVMSSVV